MSAKVKITKAEIVISRGRKGYRIALDRVNEPDWLSHLAKKTWVTPDVLLLVEKAINDVRSKA